MSLNNNSISQLFEQLKATAPNDKLSYIKGWIASCNDVNLKREATAYLGLCEHENIQGASNITQIVILLHGIRTQAIWHSLVKVELSNISGVNVYSIGYGWFNAFQFWFPIKFLRAEPEKILLREFRDIKEKHKNAHLVVIAHSFSTYLISRILEDHTDIKISKLILCGSIIPKDYRWDKVSLNDIGMTVVNEVGTRDIWPIMATVTSRGYGCSGATGFGTNRVTDRYFDFGHSDFFTIDHIQKFWLPFVIDGTISQSPWDTNRPNQSWLLNLAGSLPTISKIIFYGLLCAILWLLWKAVLPLGINIFQSLMQLF